MTAHENEASFVAHALITRANDPADKLLYAVL